MQPKTACNSKPLPGWTAICLCLLLAALLAFPAHTQAQEATAQLPQWVFDGMADLPEVPEPSGLCYHPMRDTLFIVDDGGEGRPAALYELSLQAEVLAKLELGADLEGVCFCPADQMLYVCDESNERIYVVDPDGPELRSEFTVSREFGSEEVIAAGGNGFEGIEYIPATEIHEGGYFVVLNQDDPTGLALFEHSAIAQANGQPVPLSGWLETDQVNAGELHFDQQRRELWLVHSWMNVMEVFDIDTLELLYWEVVPGCAQEAVAFDGEGRLWIGYDTGGLARYVSQ